ncbi:hypothetical protein [Lactiplantibacillus daowaiensis]|uniref:hypothetical protein n=1 Tax=Lactiplantibacillus daowaiensis TaxID=2559918 RepID=UPI0014855A95|nr:hypothetical protein [Lactiplantibacillus daowaiensis]
MTLIIATLIIRYVRGKMLARIKQMAIVKQSTVTYQPRQSVSSDEVHQHAC